MGPMVLFQLTFTFIYCTFSKKFLDSAKYVDRKQTLKLRIWSKGIIFF